MHALLNLIFLFPAVKKFSYFSFKVSALVVKKNIFSLYVVWQNTDKCFHIWVVVYLILQAMPSLKNNFGSHPIWSTLHRLGTIYSSLYSNTTSSVIYIEVISQKGQWLIWEGGYNGIPTQQLAWTHQSPQV